MLGNTQKIKNKVLSLLNSTLGLSGRGFSLREIHKILKIKNLAKFELSRILSELNDENKIYCTGNTKGKKQCAIKFKEQAVKNIKREYILHRFKYLLWDLKRVRLDREGIWHNTFTNHNLLYIVNVNNIDPKDRSEWQNLDKFVILYWLQDKKIPIDKFCEKHKIIPPLLKK